jgi:cytoskeletal protein CcmA (bactofilin family)
VQSTGAAPVNRAMSESDSMARDIKEGRLSGFVGHGTTLTGETIFTAMLRVDGHLIGNVSSDTGTLIVGTNGQVDANIMVAAAMVNGTVNGDIIATEKLQLGRTARVLGNIQSPKLIIEEGAILEGTCSMIKALKAQDEAASAAAAATQYEQAASPAEDGSLIADEDPSSLFPSEEENERSAEAAAV